MMIRAAYKRSRRQQLSIYI